MMTDTEKGGALRRPFWLPGDQSDRGDLTRSQNQLVCTP